MMKPLSSHDIAEELGRSVEWLYANWRRLVKSEAMPKPINGGGKGVELCWSAVQFYIWLDRDLPKSQRDLCAAFRAAIEAAKASPAISSEAVIIDEWKATLEERFGASA